MTPTGYISLQGMASMGYPMQGLVPKGYPSGYGHCGISLQGMAPTGYPCRVRPLRDIYPCRVWPLWDTPAGFGLYGIYLQGMAPTGYISLQGMAPTIGYLNPFAIIRWRLILKIPRFPTQNFWIVV